MCPKADMMGIPRGTRVTGLNGRSFRREPNSCGVLGLFRYGSNGPATIPTPVGLLMESPCNENYVSRLNLMGKLEPNSTVSLVFASPAHKGAFQADCCFRPLRLCDPVESDVWRNNPEVSAKRHLSLKFFEHFNVHGRFTRTLASFRGRPLADK